MLGTVRMKTFVTRDRCQRCVRTESSTFLSEKTTVSRSPMTVSDSVLRCH